MIRIFTYFFLLLIFSRCSNKTESLEVSLELKVNGQPLELGKIYKDYDDRNILFNAFKLYLSDIEISDGSNATFKDVLLFVAERNSLIFLLESPQLKAIKTVKAKIGLDTLYNNQNPIKFPDEHPLSLDQNTYWSMLKYRFLVIEGRIDTSVNKDKTPTFPFTYHIGRDTMLRDFTMQIEGDKVLLPIEILDIFNSIDMTTHFDNHSETPAEIVNGILLMNNLACVLNQCTKK